MWVDGKLCSYVEILGCQRHTASLSTGSLKPNRDRGVNQEKFTLLSAVVVTITRRPVDLFIYSGAETSCVKSTSSHSLETPKQRATGEGRYVALLGGAIRHTAPGCLPQQAHHH